MFMAIDLIDPGCSEDQAWSWPLSLFSCIEQNRSELSERLLDAFFLYVQEIGFTGHVALTGPHLPHGDDSRIKGLQ